MPLNAVALQPQASLTVEERIRLNQLEVTIGKTVHSFLTCARCLIEIREKRLWREKYQSFGDYARRRWGICRSLADQYVRSGQTAELLAAGGVELSPGTPEAVVRPVSALPSAELQVAAWRLVQAVSPECGPTQPIASKVCRILRNALEPEVNGNGPKVRHRVHPSRERPFVQAAQRLSTYTGFDATIVVAHVEQVSSAWSVHTACAKLIERCQQVQEELEARFPELADANS